MSGFSPQQWRMGREIAAGSDSFTVTSIQDAQLLAAQGELAQLPALGKSFKLVELRNDKDQILSVDFSGKQPGFTLGVPVQLEGLQMQGLRDAAATKKEEGRHFNCPKCGAVVPVRFDSTKAMSCPSCGSLVDMSKGMGASSVMQSSAKDQTRHSIGQRRNAGWPEVAGGRFSKAHRSWPGRG